jgi:hypothetical protein
VSKNGYFGLEQVGKEGGMRHVGLSETRVVTSAGLLVPSSQPQPRHRHRLAACHRLVIASLLLVL